MPDRSRGLERWIIDPGTRSIKVRSIDRGAQEFPRIDERLFGRKHRYVYTLSQPDDPNDPALGCSALYRHDLDAGTKQVHDFGESRFPGEFVFVAKSSDSSEREGWLVGFVIDEPTDSTEFVILDADAFESEPVARVQLPHRIPPGFHGNWVPRA